MEFWMVSTFWPLWIMLLWAWLYRYWFVLFISYWLLNFSSFSPSVSLKHHFFCSFQLTTMGFSFSQALQILRLLLLSSSSSIDFSTRQVWYLLMICPHPPVFWSLWAVSFPLELFWNFIALLSSCSVFVWGLKEIEKLSCHCYCLLRIPQLFLSLTFYSLCLTSYMLRHLLLCSAHFFWRFISGNPLRTGKKLHSSRQHSHFPLLDTWGHSMRSC